MKFADWVMVVENPPQNPFGEIQTPAGDIWVTPVLCVGELTARHIPEFISSMTKISPNYGIPGVSYKDVPSSAPGFIKFRLIYKKLAQT